MKKFRSAFKKLAAAALSAALAVTALPGGFTAYADLVDYTGTFDAYIYFLGSSEGSDDYDLMYVDPDSSENSADITVQTAEGFAVGDTVTVSMEFAKPVGEIAELAPVIKADGVMDLGVKKVKLFVDGEEVKTTKSAGDEWWYPVESIRDTIYLYGAYFEFDDEHQYLKDKDNVPTGFTKLEYEITLSDALESDVTFDPDGEYNAYIGFQTPAYSFRNPWWGDNGNYGLGYEDPAYPGVDFFHQVTGWDADNKAITVGGTLTDAVIDGNGTYTVSANGLEFADDDFASDNLNAFRLLYVSTDLPNTGDVLVDLDSVVLTIDGNEIEIKPALDAESREYIKLDVQNKYSNKPDLMDIGYYPTPMKDISITFTVSGFNKEGSGSGADAPAAPEDPGDSTEHAETGSETGGEETGTPAGDGTDNKTSESSSDPAPTKAAESASQTDKADDSSNTGLIVGIVAAVVVVAGACIGIGVSKKKKNI